MKKNILFAMSLLLVATSMSAAKKDKKAEEAAPIYAIKSGVIITSTDMSEMSEMFGDIDMDAMRERFANRPGADTTMMQMFDWSANSEQVEMVYFDDYGAKQATVSKMGGRTTRTITDDNGDRITINEEQKTATRMPSFGGRGGMGGFGGGFGMGGGSSAPVNFNALDAKTIKKNKIKELGTEEIAGKLCTIYSVRILQMQQYITNKYWVYKGIVMKSETTSFMSDNPIVTTVTSLEEDAVMPEGIFEVPEGVEVKEMNFGGMGDFGGFGGGDFGGGMGGFGGGGFGGGMGGFGGGMF